MEPPSVAVQSPKAETGSEAVWLRSRTVASKIAELLDAILGGERHRAWTTSTIRSTSEWPPCTVAQATPPYRWSYAAFRSCAPSNEIGNTMDKVREADQVKRTACIIYECNVE